MFERFDHYRKFIDGNQVSKVTQEVLFRETSKDGECRARFGLRGTCLRLVPASDEHPVRWFREKQCADGAFLTAAFGGLKLHLVELKSRVGLEKWDKVRSQFEGMFWNSFALARTIGLPEIVSVQCYIVYTRDEVRADRIASPAILRTMPARYIEAAEDWRAYRVCLPRGFVAPLTKRLRPDPPDVDFGEVG